MPETLNPPHLGFRQQDEVQRLDHVAGELQVLLRPQQRRKPLVHLVRAQVGAQPPHHQLAAALQQRHAQRAAEAVQQAEQHLPAGDTRGPAAAVSDPAVGI